MEESGRKNHIQTTKYTVWNLIPKFLYEQFSEFSNLLFLVIAVTQFFKVFDLFGPQATSAPLTMIILFAFCKEVWEDYKRYLSNRRDNRQMLTAYARYTGWTQMRWQQLRPGGVVMLRKGDSCPADVVLISSSEPEGIAYIETSNLDGETNLKVRKALSVTAHAVNQEDVTRILWNATLTVEQPNKKMYSFSGSLLLRALPKAANRDAANHEQKETSSSIDNSTSFALDKSQFLPRGARVKNTDYVFGIVVYTGMETKIMLNSVRSKNKRSHSSRLTMYILMIQFGMLLIFSATLSILAFVYDKTEFLEFVGFQKEKKSVLVGAILYIMLLAGFVPISLYISVETIQLVQSSLIHSDFKMYDEDTDTCADARNSTLTPQLGEVKYLMADKTGTLTRNEMVFKNCSVGGIKYGSKNSQTFNPRMMIKDLKSNFRGNQKELLHFMTACAICHTVVPETRNDDVLFHASSPDEYALVSFAKNAGFQFHTRTPTALQIKETTGDVPCNRSFSLLYVMEFDSTTKRMGVIVRTENGEIILYVKGADSSIFPNLNAKKEETDRLIRHLDTFARRGMRTLCFAYREISPATYDQWWTDMKKVISNHSSAQDEIVTLEQNLLKRVPETIERILSVGIHVWILTGDKLETAINIGYSCKLLSSDANLFVLSCDSKDGVSKLLRSWIEELGEERLSASLDIAVIVDAGALEIILADKNMQTDFMRIALVSYSVICCRCTPLQKAHVTRLVRQFANGCVMAIGDGGNDIAMIQESDVGVGICGKEGMQAAMTADFSLAQFKHLDRLLFVHGTLSLFRLNKVILFMLYKNVMEACVLGLYAIVSGYSFQIYTDKFHIIFYNLFYTSLAPLVIGIFDRPMPVHILAKYPSYYDMYQKCFSAKTHLGWILLAFYHAVIIFAGAYFYEKSAVSLWKHGRENHLQIYGFTMFYVSYAAFGVSLLMPIVWVVQQSLAYPLLPWGNAALKDIISQIPSVGFFSFVFVMIFITLAPDYLAKVISRTFVMRPQLEHLEHGGLLAPPRILLDPLLKIADIVGIRTDFTKTGYAFSQDDGSVLKQAELMKAYDTRFPRQPGTERTMEDDSRIVSHRTALGVTDRTVDSDAGTPID